MNENIDLTEILKGCPKGTKLYSPLFGELEFVGFVEDKDDIGSLPIRVTNNSCSFCFSIDGKRNNVIVCEECMLFPSKDVRTWDNFKPKNPKFDPKTLQPFDKVIVRYYNDRDWSVNLFSHLSPTKATKGVIACGSFFKYCIPYNEETKHLVGTTDKAPEYYRYWEE